MEAPLHSRARGYSEETHVGSASFLALGRLPQKMGMPPDGDRETMGRGKRRKLIFQPDQEPQIDIRKRKWSGHEQKEDTWGLWRGH